MHTFSFIHGLPFGKDGNIDYQHDVTLRELGAEDMIAAEIASEKVVMTAKGPALLSSPAIMGFELLRRCVARVGVIQGPLTMAQLGSLHKDDLAKLLDETQQNHDAAINTLQAVIAEGR